MKRLIPILLCLSLIACKHETIPIVTVEMLPPELVSLSADTTFDTIPYQLVEVKIDTIYVDSLLPDSLVIESISVDTLRTDTFSVDTFFVDTIRLWANVSVAGDHLYAPALNECGFCVNSTEFYPVWLSMDAMTPADEYGLFWCELTAKNTDILNVYAYVLNLSGEIHSQWQVITMSDYDSR